MKSLAKIIIIIYCFTTLTQALAHSLESSFYSSINCATVQGFAQIPKGGGIGSTSLKRPTFSEMGIHQDKFYNLGAKVRYIDYFAILDYYHFNPEGQVKLNRSLITHNQAIPRKSPFEMRSQFDWYALGVGMDFHLYTTTLSPILLIDWVKYHYEFFSFPLESVRSFSLVGANIGLLIERYLTPQFATTIQVNAPLPYSNIKIIQVIGGLSLDIPFSPTVVMIPKLMLGWLQLDYIDEQTVPNHVRYRGSPYVGVELRVTVKSSAKEVLIS